MMIEKYEPAVSVIIPTLNAEKEISDLITNLKNQTVKVSEMIVVDSSSDDETAAICRQAESVRLIEIARKDFDHGKTRDFALRESTGEVVVFLTQDAVPANASFLEKLIRPLSEDKVAVSTGRQLPRMDSSEMEKLVRAFNYPDVSSVRSKEDIARLGIKTFFCSDVCAAYRRDIYLELGGFDYPIKTNEDMFFAAAAINAGYRIAYAADALVVHSHDFTLKQQYKRNYIQGYEIERHRQLLGNVKQESEGKRLVKYVAGNLLRRGEGIELIRFGADCCARLLGSRAGKREAIRKKSLLGTESESTHGE